MKKIMEAFLEGNKDWGFDFNNNRDMFISKRIPLDFDLPHYETFPDFTAVLSVAFSLRSDKIFLTAYAWDAIRQSETKLNLSIEHIILVVDELKKVRESLKDHNVIPFAESMTLSPRDFTSIYNENKVNSKGDNQLSILARNSDSPHYARYEIEPVIEHLLSYGADINLKNKLGVSAFYIFKENDFLVTPELIAEKDNDELLKLISHNEVESPRL